jgi:hypothetical protein
MAVLAICIDMPDLLAEASHPAESIASAAMGYLLEHLGYLLLQMALAENEVYRMPYTLNITICYMGLSTYHQMIVLYGFG